jgi:hypothetical protein
MQLCFILLGSWWELWIEDVGKASPEEGASLPGTSVQFCPLLLLLYGFSSVCVWVCVCVFCSHKNRIAAQN